MESNFSQKEKNTIAFWKKFKIFEKSVAARKNAEDFVFYEGPPTANARPGFHHVLARIFKDIICRYKTMEGHRVIRRAGWDTHGLPVELQVEKKLGFTQKKDIESYGIAEFNKKCKESVWEYKKEFESLTERIGFWLDMESPYITYERGYMESVWFILKAVWDKKLLYQDFKVVPYCPRCGTPLSSHEVAQGYKRVKDRSIYVKFKILNPEFKNCSLLIWTTTPWTLPGNVAVAVNEDFDYVRVKEKKDDGEKQECLILAKSRLKVLQAEYEILSEMKGKNLVGLRYQPIFAFSDEAYKNAYKVIAGKFVSLEDGTGLVHIAPAFGEDDMNVIKEQNKNLRREGLYEFPIPITVNTDGKFTLDVKQFAGLFVKEADTLIIENLKNRNILYKEELYEHDYPFCWRCKTPLIYYATKSWFIEMTKLKADLVKNNKKINWIPSYLKEGRFGEWLREVKDWAISRERYWATPLPIWQCSKCGHTEVAGSLKDVLSKKFSTNRYFVFRHGESQRQIKKIASCWPEANPLPLTKKGKAEVKTNAEKLKKERIDLIISSDILRTKETAQIVSEITGAKVIFDKRLREFSVGVYNGKDPKSVWDHLAKFKKPLEEKLSGGESIEAVKKRMYEFFSDTNKKYQDQNIAVISHEFPLTLLEGTMKGMETKEIVEKRSSGKIKKIETGKWREIEFKVLPFDESMEIDLHRPYIDKIKFACPKCGGLAERVKDVLDCWFDSGAMPFAQNRWPFTLNAKTKKLAPLAFFPADFICEAIDQTRGWFYTLLAVSTTLGFGTPYKNVLSLGHVLDAKGEKMSKSKGNVIDPWEMAGKYCADAIRWYLYTINSPGESKMFNEKDVDLAVKKFLLTYLNCYIFLETYGKDYKTSKVNVLPKGVLDRWIVSKTNQLIFEVTEALEGYNVTAAARAIEKFTVNDLSLWYIRRSRRRLQQPENKTELLLASKILGYVIVNLTKISAPFIPFLSEDIYQRLNGYSFQGEYSIHLENWPKPQRKLIDRKLNEEMEKAREIVTLALAERAKLGIKIRQPLLKLKIKPQKSGKGELKFEKAMIDLIASEVNVKRVTIDNKLKNLLQFDTNITPELKEEGLVREILRHLQEARKQAGYTPKDTINIFAETSDNLKNIVVKNKEQILRETKTKQIIFKKSPSAKAVKVIKTDFGELWIGIKKC